MIDPSKIKPWGTDGCAACETGRVTLFIANTKCISCAPEEYEERHVPMPDTVMRLTENLERAENALREIKKAVGTSTEAWHIADKALFGREK